MKKRFLKDLIKEHFRVAIFGSARIKRNDVAYKQIYKLGWVLGKRNIDIVTGGGPGLMEAANSGHKEGNKKTGAYSIGLNIKLLKEQMPNKHLDVKAEFAVFSERLDKFMELSNAVVVAHGGVGTLLELMYAWQLSQVEHIRSIPIILLGGMWEGFGEWLRREPMRRKYFEKNDIRLLFFTRKIEEVIEIIDDAHESFKKGEKDFCIDYQKYGSP
ncbi:LOG family protein [Candidatus Pacearchaeota archaeon]|nr:LOG family protein [Candidatus Pacearchaeota archaeon]